jgi:hypothetical protein
MLSERRERYGKFVDHSAIAQDLKDVMRKTPGWQRLAPDQKESLEMVQHKIARVLNGDPNYADNWIDLAGYPTLVSTRLEGEAL